MLGPVRMDRTILIVEDDEVDQIAIQRSLDPLAESILIAGDGDRGLKLFMTARPDLVVTDLQMFSKNGFEMIKAIRKIDTEVPIIVHSGYTSESMISKEVAQWTRYMITKSSDNSDLVELAEALLHTDSASHANLKDYGATNSEIKDELERVNLRYEYLIDNISDGFVISTIDGDILRTNPAMQQLLGASNEELLTTNLSIFNSTADRIEHRKNLLEQGKTGPYRLQFTNAEGRVLEIKVEDYLIEDEKSNSQVWSFIQDITTEEKYKRELESSNADLSLMVDRLELATQAADMGVWYWNLVDDSVEWDRRQCEIYQVPPDVIKAGVSHQFWQNRVHPNDLQRVEEKLQAAIGGGEPFDDEFRIVLPDGKISMIHSAAIIKYDEQSRPIRMVGINRDITLLRESEEALKQARDAATQANQAKDEFLAVMSHELRTPLTAIIGHAEVLLENKNCSQHHMKDDPLIRSSLVAIERAGRDQLTLVNDILDASKMESGKFAVETAPYNLGSLIDEVAAMFSGRYQEKGILFNVERDLTESCMVVGDAQRIKQILINLIGNALKFTDQGSVTLSCSIDENRLVFTVKDSGIGMSERVIAQLFNRFQQADGSITRRYGGSGLGLYISMYLAEMMGGTIEVDSTEGVGSLFKLLLPYQKSDQEERRSNQSEQGEIEEEASYTGHVLVAEDTPAIQLLMKRILENTGLTVVVADNGQQAIEQVSGQPVDLIFMDMQMPVMNGIEACKMIRDKGYKTPIIALTANVMQKHRDQFRKAGCDGFLGKPIDKRDLKGVLKKYL